MSYVINFGLSHLLFSLNDFKSNNSQVIRVYGLSSCPPLNFYHQILGTFGNIAYICSVNA